MKPIDYLAQTIASEAAQLTLSTVLARLRAAYIAARDTYGRESSQALALSRKIDAITRAVVIAAETME
ncbi:MAG: hypothetical protein IT464_12585 [Planctomycetes bacterium]|nr:hypothetical protein [Planctomycetota bacterium]